MLLIHGRGAQHQLFSSQICSSGRFMSHREPPELGCSGLFSSAEQAAPQPAVHTQGEPCFAQQNRIREFGAELAPGG